MRRLAAAVAVLGSTLVLVAGCGAEEPPAAPTETESIEITFTEGSVTPNGERVEVEAGQPVELVVQADEPGELHVHSTPEEELPYGAGTTTLELTIDQPGVVEVESHHLEQTVVQLEVR